jgi:hypothetical protein
LFDDKCLRAAFALQAREGKQLPTLAKLSLQADKKGRYCFLRRVAVDMSSSLTWWFRHEAAALSPLPGFLESKL